MSIETAANYSFDFAELAKVQAPLKTLGDTFKAMSLRPTPAEELNLIGTFYALAERGGILAALNRLLPDDYTGGIIKAQGPRSTISKELRIGALRIVRSRALGLGYPIDLTDLRCSVAAPLPGIPDAAYKVFSQREQFIDPGPWLQTLQDAANKKPEHRHESPAAFQRFLRHG
jgi:hypothetical protein